MHTTFTKYEGAGNDFILIDNRSGEFIARAELIARLCDRHTGIGADGLMTLGLSEVQECSMRYYNADGSEGEMCGNGARCFALFAHHLGIGGTTKLFEAGDGLHQAIIGCQSGFEGEVEVGMIDVGQICDGNGWWSLNTGVPHYVEFTEDLDAVDVVGRGREIRYDTERFAKGTNVNFVQITGDGAFRMRTYERGVENETLACGTGATAAAVVINYALQHHTTHFRIAVPGGRLSVEFDHQPGTQHYTQIRLTGPARRVFEGQIDTSNFLNNQESVLNL